MKKILLTFVSMMVVFSTSLHAEVPTQESVTKLYVATFNRAPDAAGLNYWVNDAGLQLEQISESFFDQPETQALYPPETSAYDFVLSVYDNLFNREPDPAGLAYWEEELQSGRIPKSMFILAVINGALDTVEYGNDATILTNKTTVGLAYADAGLDDVDDATEIMSGITDDYATVTAALEEYGIGESPSLAGTEWSVVETVNTNTCILDPGTQTYDMTIVSYSDGVLTVDTPAGTFSGTYSGDNISYSGSYTRDEGTATVSAVLTVNSTSDKLMGTSTYTVLGEYYGIPIDCGGTTNVDATRK